MKRKFTYPRELYESQEIDKKKIIELIKKHQSEEVSRLQRNMQYYDAKHAILENERESGAPNAKTVCNHAKDISDTASGFFMGNPISYTAKDSQSDISALTDAFSLAGVDDADQDNALQLSIYGCSYEYIYAAEEEAELNIENLEPENTFIVYDDTIEHRELFGVYYYSKENAVSGQEKFVALVATDREIKKFDLYPGPEPNGKETSSEVHNLGYIPIIEYKNNKYCIGDFEQQIELIDAYNTLMADRINDKEQFIDAILVIYGAILGDSEKESDDAQKRLARKKLLELDTDAKAEYLTRTFDENGVETLRKAIKEDIYTFSHVPNLTDEKFSGNSSGVAMEYKLLGLEMLTKIKERYYRRALKKRIRIFIHFLTLKAKDVDENNLTATFSRSLPKNLVELANILSTLSDMVSKKTLIKQIPFVEDPDEEITAVEEEKEKTVQRQQKLFAGTENMPLDGEDEE